MATPSIAMIPSAYKAGTAYSVLPLNGDGDFDFTRAGGKTRINEAQQIELLATGVPSIDYTSGGCPSLLLEPQSTNLITYSEDYTQWPKSGNMAITPNNAISPDGTQNASLLTANASNQFIYLSSFSSANSTISLYIKRKTGTGNIELSNNGGASYTALSVTDEWSRVQVTFATSTNQTVIKINTSGDEVYLWGVQVEQQSSATSYIPTTGAISTRIADVATLDLTPFTLTSITETIGGVEQTPITVIPSTYTAPYGAINKIIME